jgi:hypothetical protein
MGLFVASAFTFTSCTDDGEAASMVLNYSVNGVSKGEAAGTIQEAVGSKIDLEATFTMGSNKIEKVQVELAYQGDTYTLLDTTLSTGIFNASDKTFTYDFSTNVGEKNKVLTLRAIDTQGIDTSFVVTIKPTAESIATGKVKTSTAKILGGQNNANGSLYSLYLDEVVKLAQGAAMYQVVDLVYYYGATNKATLSSPSADGAKSVYSSIANWTSRNVTGLLLLSTTATEFDAIDTETKFTTAYGTVTPSSDYLATLAVGKVFAMVTSTGKKALVKVKEISAASNAGAITIEVKTIQ